MTLTATVTEQGVFHCDRCNKVLKGFDSMFDICNDCANLLIVEVTEGDDDKPAAGDDDDDTSDIPTGVPAEAI